LRSGLPSYILAATFRKLSAKALLFVMLLVPVTTALTWKAKSLEKELFGRSDEVRLVNEQAPEFKLRFPA